jgi:hypothetical protein
MSLARLWRDQRKVQEARDLLAPVYGGSLKGSIRESEGRKAVALGTGFIRPNVRELTPVGNMTVGFAVDGHRQA